jgi:7-carboxy-7-deazaguanine synthase
MKINEIFYSVQGEGRWIGYPSIFVRASGCNLRCPWCDSKYALEEGKDIPIQNIMKRISGYPAKRVTITGGEPTLQEEELVKLLRVLRRRKYSTQIETNGTIKFSPKVIKLINNITCSPKFLDTTWLFYYPNYPFVNDFKFVVEKEKEVLEVKQFIKAFTITGNVKNFYLMPKAATREEYVLRASKVVQWCKKYGFRFSPREQIVIYDNQRGI